MIKLLTVRHISHNIYTYRAITAKSKTNRTHRSDEMNHTDILNKDFLMACQLEAIGQLKEKGVTEAEIMANPKLFAQKSL